VTVTAGVSPYYRRLRNGLSGFLRDEARYVGELTTREVTKLTPVAKVMDVRRGESRGVSGRARRSWKPIAPRRKQTGAQITWESGAESDDDVIPILETGARRHVIVARDAVELVFWSHGQKIRAERVNHPGFPGFHMMERGSREAEREYARVSDARFQRFLDER
jgi:hypothetical protein